MCVEASLCACQNTPLEVRWQFKGLGSLLPPCGVQGLNSGQSGLAANVCTHWVVHQPVHVILWNGITQAVLELQTLLSPPSSEITGISLHNWLYYHCNSCRAEAPPSATLIISSPIPSHLPAVRNNEPPFIRRILETQRSESESLFYDFARQPSV